MWLFGLALVGACSSSSSSEDCVLPTGSTSATPSDGADPACSAVIVVGLYKDDQCTPGTEVLKVTLDVAEPCSGWFHGAASDPTYDSGSRFQCYRDRLCYTQYVATCACSSESASLITDKQARTTCMKDDTPNIWTRILSGTDSCPEAPAGFECPSSDPGQGNSQLGAACAL